MLNNNTKVTIPGRNAPQTNPQIQKSQQQGRGQFQNLQNRSRGRGRSTQHYSESGSNYERSTSLDDSLLEELKKLNSMIRQQQVHIQQVLQDQAQIQLKQAHIERIVARLQPTQSRPTRRYQNEEDSKLLLVIGKLHEFVQCYRNDRDYNIQEKLGWFNDDLKQEILFHRSASMAARFRQGFDHYNEVATAYNPEHIQVLLPPPVNHPSPPIHPELHREMDSGSPKCIVKTEPK